MERLTHKDSKGWYIHDQSIAYDECRRGEEIDLLAAYENTELTPEQIMEADKTLKDNWKIRLDRLKEAIELIKAKDEGRLVVLPPVKVGDEAFFIIKKQIFSGTVYYLRWEHHKSFGIRGDISADCMGGCVGARLSDFGKTVFLTREVAEAALKEQEG